MAFAYTVSKKEEEILEKRGHSGWQRLAFAATPSNSCYQLRTIKIVFPP